MFTRGKIGGLALFAALAVAPAGWAADYYRVDPAHTTILFSVNHANISFVYGFFRKAEGAYMLDKANPSRSQFRFIVDVNSIDTNHEERDKHLRSGDFFDAERFPAMEFASTKCELVNTPDGSTVYNVTGDMTIHGVTRPVTLPMRILAEGQGPFRDYRTGFHCQFEVKRSQFGMNNLPGTVGDTVSITISFEGKRQDETPPR